MAQTMDYKIMGDVLADEIIWKGVADAVYFGSLPPIVDWIAKIGPTIHIRIGSKHTTAELKVNEGARELWLNRTA